MEDPASAARAIANHILQSNATTRDGFRDWGYGPSIIVDAMVLATENEKYSKNSSSSSSDLMSQWVNPLLDGYLKASYPNHIALDLLNGEIPPPGRPGTHHGADGRSNPNSALTLTLTLTLTRTPTLASGR